MYRRKRRTYAKRAQHHKYTHKGPGNPRADTLLSLTRYSDQKLVHSFPVVLGGSVGYNSLMPFARFQFQNLPGSTTLPTYGINTPARWTQVVRDWNQYAVTGFELEYYPAVYAGPTDVPALQQLLVWEDLNTYDISNYTQAQILSSEGFKAYDPKKAMRLFRDGRPLTKQMNSAWQDCQAPSNAPNGLPNASLCLNAIGTGFVLTTPSVDLGYVKATWYVTFRGQKGL